MRSALADVYFCFARPLKCLVFLCRVGVRVRVKSPLRRLRFYKKYCTPSNLPCLDYLTPLETIQTIVLWKERFDATSVQKKNFSANNRIKLTTITQNLRHLIRDLVPLQT